MATKRECDRCKQQIEASDDEDSLAPIVSRRGGFTQWAKIQGHTVGDDYGFKLSADLCGHCWKLLREDFMGGNNIAVLNRVEL